ncbi:MAG: arsenate reductase ArsC [Gaiellaceae bacterium]|jgi:arsenate reductase (thioredoxin)
MKRALFVCIGNAGRSQMAQAFYERIGGEARSAGSRPETQLHASVVDAMQELGIDISERRPKGFTDADVKWADVIVTMGCGDVCPFFPGKTYVDWNLPDPASMSPVEVRTLRDDIERRIGELAR